MSSEVIRLTEEYFLHRLDLSSVSDMRDISGLCQQFIERGRQILEYRPEIVLTNPVSVASGTTPVGRVELKPQEVAELAWQVWDEQSGQLSTDCPPKLKALGGLRLCFISAIQLLGVENTKRVSMSSTTHDPRAVIVIYFYKEYAREFAHVVRAGFSQEGLTRFENRLDGSLKNTTPINRWWESQST